MKKRRFSFHVPATLMLSVEAETEAEAWLQIKQQKPEQFSVVPYEDEDWFVVTPVYELAKMVGYECPPDDSDTRK